MAGITNRGKYLFLQWGFNNGTRPTNYYVHLVTSATSPTQDTNVMSDLTQITSGNGYYSSGYQLTPNVTDFPSLTENDSTDKAYVSIKNVSWTAAGGNIPSGGDGARWAVLSDDNATVANRQIIAYFDLSANRTVSDTQTLTLSAMQLSINET